MFDAAHLSWMRDPWYPNCLVALQSLSNIEHQNMVHWIHAHVFDIAVVRGEMNVTQAIREFIGTDGEWPPTCDLFPLWNKTGQDWDYARQLYGNVVCQIGILRPEIFVRFKSPVGRDRPESSSYRYQPTLGWLAAFGPPPVVVHPSHVGIQPSRSYSSLSATR